MRYCDPQTQYEIERKAIEKVMRLLDRPDCKTAREILTKAWTTFELKRTTQ